MCCACSSLKPYIRKIDRINEKLASIGEVLRYAEKDCQENPNNAEAQAFYRIHQEKYEEMNGVYEKYKNGQITIDEALSLLGIVY